MNHLLDAKTILVTGGTGSMGKTFIGRALSGEYGIPHKIIVFSRDEAKQHDMRMQYARRPVQSWTLGTEIEFRIGDVRRIEDVISALRDVQIVINAAALKQVPSCEYFPMQAVLTNCMGTHNIIRAIEDFSLPVETVVTISTDKACKPTTVMGMTKAIQERMIVAANILNKMTRFVGVRYGNVLVSRGSVIPLFHEQIRAGGPVTVTVPEMTRFLLSLDQAVETMLAALGGARPGEIYVPATAPSATILNIARALLGDVTKIEIQITGIRPAEKLHEIMVSQEEVSRTVRRGDYYAILPTLPELSYPAEPRALEREFSSADNVLDLVGTKILLERHGLLI